MDLGATTETLGYEVEWVLGDGKRWVNMNDGSEINLPQPLKKAKISAHTTQHSVPSCAWKVSLAQRKGKFDRESTKHMPDEVKAKLASGEMWNMKEKSCRLQIFDNALPPLSVIISGDTAEQAIDAECDLNS